MRGWQIYPIIGISILGWLIAMALMPTYLSEESPLFKPGVILIIMCLTMKILSDEIFKHSPRAVAPGLNCTIASPEPISRVKIADFKLSPGLSEYNIYAMNGTPIGPMPGGGKEGGHAVVPADCDIQLLNQHCWNFVFDIYRARPNKRRGQKDIQMLPTPILDALRQLSTWHEETTVIFGRIPYRYYDVTKIKNRDLKDELDMAWQLNKQLTDQNAKLRTALTEQSQTIKHIISSYPEIRANFGPKRGTGIFNSDNEEE